MWLSETGIPQSVTLDISGLHRRGPFLQTFGLHCWHSYASNPRLLELLVSQDGTRFISWATLRPEMTTGSQYFAIDPLGPTYRFLQLVVRETFGASKTYINALFLYAERLGAPSPAGLPLDLATPPRYHTDAPPSPSSQTRH